MTTIYVVGATNDYLVTGLHDPHPLRRAESAETIGSLHVYAALPELLDTARSDPDAMVRGAARQAIVGLMPSEEAAERAIAGKSLSETPERVRPHKDDAAWVIWTFEQYVLYRMNPGNRPNQDDLVGLTIGHLARWSGQSALDLDEVELAAARAVGAIARFLEIPNQSPGAKAMSFRDAEARVADYKSVVPTIDETEED